MVSCLWIERIHRCEAPSRQAMLFSCPLPMQRPSHICNHFSLNGKANNHVAMLGHRRRHAVWSSAVKSVYGLCVSGSPFCAIRSRRPREEPDSSKGVNSKAGWPSRILKQYFNYHTRTNLEKGHMLPSPSKEPCPKWPRTPRRRIKTTERATIFFKAHWFLTESYRCPGLNKNSIATSLASCLRMPARQHIFLVVLYS